MPIHIRTAIHDDAAPLVNIYNQYLGKATQDTIFRQAGFFIKMINNLGDRETMLVAEKEKTVVGYGILKKYSWKEGYKFAGEISLFLDGKNLGGGIGKKLMHQLIEQAKEFDYNHLVARIMAINKKSIQFHRKLGYEMVGIQKRIGFVNGEWRDAAVMQLLLHEESNE